MSFECHLVETFCTYMNDEVRISWVVRLFLPFYLSLSYLHCFVVQVYCEYWVLSLSVVRWMMCCCTLTLSRTGNTDWRIPFHSLGWRSGSFIKSSNVVISLISNHISPFKFHGSSCAIKGAGSGGFWINYWPVFLPLFFLISLSFWSFICDFYWFCRSVNPS